jgi:hypothetical protein
LHGRVLKKPGAQLRQASRTGTSTAIQASPAPDRPKEIPRGIAKALERILMMWLLVALFCHMALGL